MDVKFSRNSLIGICGLALLALMMIFISQIYEVKLLLMLTLLILIRKTPGHISLKVRIAYFIVFLYGLDGIFFGLLYQTAKPFMYVTIYCIYPTLFFIYSFHLTKNKYFENILKAIFFAHVFIVFYDLLFAWCFLLGISFPNIYTIDVPFAIYDSSSRMNFLNLSTLTFSTPVLFLLLLGNYKIGISRLFQGIVLILTFFLFIISGRRSVMLIMLVLPFFPFIFSSFFSKNIKGNILKSTIVCLILIVCTVVYVNSSNPKFIEDYTQVFLKAFDSDEEPIKFAQKTMLLEKFYEKPIFGHGAGAMFYEPSPGRTQWNNQYELSYHHKLANTGIFGFILIMSVYLWIFFYGIYLAKKKNDFLFLTLLVGFFFMLIADAANPVLSSFDLIWPIYLCLARINYWDFNKRLLINEKKVHLIS